MITERDPHAANAAAANPVLTPWGVRRLRARIAEIRDAYLAVCASNEEAAGAGDSSVWHDNFAYEENQRQMHQLARRVRDLEGILARARVVDLPNGAPESTRVGTVVTFEPVDDGETRRFLLTGLDDGKLAAGRVAYNSPLGQALVGREVGDIVELGVNGQCSEFEVTEVRAATETEDEEGLQ
jgi:transcription elongation factor GreA